MPNHTYKLKRSGQVSIQNEARLKPYWASLDATRAAPLLEPRRQTTTCGRQQHRSEYKVVVARAEDLVRQERPLPSTEVCPPPPVPSLTPPLSEPDTDPEVQTPPPRGGAPSGDIGEESTVTSRLKTPPVRHNSPLVSIPPPAVTTPPGQCIRQPPEYLKDLICDCAISGKYKSPIRCHTGRLAKKRGSSEHHSNINFCLGVMTNEIHPAETKSPSHVSQPRCPVLSYADAVKSRLAKKQ